MAWWRRLQYIWWGRDLYNWGLEFTRFTYDKHGSWAFVYSWILVLGPLEIRFTSPLANWFETGASA